METFKVDETVIIKDDVKNFIDSGYKDSDGNEGQYVNEEMAKDDTYNTKLVKPDYLANITMNMGGLASDVEGSPFKDWNMILFPYATGDFHAGTGEFKYTDKDGKEKILDGARIPWQNERGR